LKKFVKDAQARGYSFEPGDTNGRKWAWKHVIEGYGFVGELSMTRQNELWFQWQKYFASYGRKSLCDALGDARINEHCPSNCSRQGSKEELSDKDDDGI
jgi:hypothetical protein